MHCAGSRKTGDPNALIRFNRSRSFKTLEFFFFKWEFQSIDKTKGNYRITVSEGGLRVHVHMLNITRLTVDIYITMLT